MENVFGAHNNYSIGGYQHENMPTMRMIAIQNLAMLEMQNNILIELQDISSDIKENSNATQNEINNIYRHFHK